MSSVTNEVTVGSRVLVKVGCREIEATVLELTETDCRVKSIASGKEFSPKQILRVIAPPERAEAEQPMPETPAETEAPNPASECAAPQKPAKKMSLMDAAVEVLKTGDHPMNTRELVKAAAEQGLWIPTACKTPEQTLYGSIFREIATKEDPRIVKSEQKGKFEIAR